MVLVFASQVFWCFNSLFSHSWLFLNKNVSTWTTTIAFGISVDFGYVMYTCVYTWVYNDWSVRTCVYVTRGEGNISFCFFFCCCFSIAFHIIYWNTGTENHYICGSLSWSIFLTIKLQGSTCLIPASITGITGVAAPILNAGAGKSYSIIHFCLVRILPTLSFLQF